MKIIDLLNKIAKGEKVPEFIEVPNRFTKENEILFTCTENIFHCLDNNELTLNSIISAVEDKEEDKEIEEIKINLKSTRPYTEQIEEKLNELIREVNKLKENK